MNTQTNFQAANGGKRALGKHAGFQSEEEQPATKPAHTPMPWRFSRVEPEDFSGMKAWGDAYEIVSTDENPAKELYVGFCLRPDDAAHIVKCVNAHAELVAVLERCHGMFQQSPLNKDGNWLSSQLARDIRKALSNAKAQA